jgi:hypothetical protein
MKGFSIRENNPQQIIVLPTNAIKRLKTNGTIWPIQYVFVKGFVYKQGFAYMNVRICTKENVKSLIENWLVRFIE